MMGMGNETLLPSVLLGYLVTSLVTSRTARRAWIIYLSMSLHWERCDDLTFQNCRISHVAFRFLYTLKRGVWYPDLNDALPPESP